MADEELSRSELGIKKEFVILYFGLIRKYKGVPYLIEAFNKLPGHIAEKSKLIIVGEEWGDDVSISKMIESSPYREQIIYRLQYVPDEMIPRYFSVANVIVLPYLRTAGSGVANIAMTYGKPIISSAIEAMKECMLGYDGASFAPPGDSTAITEKLIEVYNKHKSGKPMEYSTTGNTWDEVARHYELIMKQFGIIK
jgi:glycosyltransferase involved in cell wall biosynthesis